MKENEIMLILPFVKALAMKRITWQSSSVFT